MSNISPLRYNDENDRAYGVTGMTIAMLLWDGEDYLASVNLDNPVGRSIEFTPAFGFTGNPRLTASLAWRELLKQFELSMAMIMGNVICRSYVAYSRPLARDVNDQLRDIVRAEGRDACSLDEDEADIIFNKTQQYLDRVFTHSGVTSVARNFASALSQRRRLSSGEVFDLLAALNSL